MMCAGAHREETQSDISRLENLWFAFFFLLNSVCHNGLKPLGFWWLDQTKSPFCGWTNDGLVHSSECAAGGFRCVQVIPPRAEGVEFRA